MATEAGELVAALVSTVKPQPGDVVVVTAPRVVTHEEAASIQYRCKLLFPDNPVLVVSDGLTVDVATLETVARMLGFQQAECRFCGNEPTVDGDQALCLDDHPHHYLWDASPLADPGASTPSREEN